MCHDRGRYNFWENCWEKHSKAYVLVLSGGDSSSPTFCSTVTCPIRKQAEHTPRTGNTGPAPWAGLALGLTELIKELPQECRLALCSYFDIRFFGLCKHKAAKTKEAFQLYFFLTSFVI